MKPFGLGNARATFRRLIDMALSCVKNCMAYVWGHSGLFYNLVRSCRRFAINMLSFGEWLIDSQVNKLGRSGVGAGAVRKHDHGIYLPMGCWERNSTNIRSIWNEITWKEVAIWWQMHCFKKVFKNQTFLGGWKCIWVFVVLLLIWPCLKYRPQMLLLLPCIFLTPDLAGLKKTITTKMMSLCISITSTMSM